MSAKGVFTRIKRVTFVEKTLAEVGDGMPECLLVTPDQLAELLYRAKDGRFSGEVSAAYAFTDFRLTFTDGALPADYFSGTTSDVVIQRAYADTGTPPVNLDGERGIWVSAKSVPSPTSTILPSLQTHSLVTGLTHYAESYAFPASGYYPYGYNVGGGGVEYQAAAELAFGSTVAWVDTSGSGNPFDPANSLWLAVGFSCYSVDAIAALLNAYTLATGDPNEGESGDLSIVLAGGVTITCKLYAGNYAFLTSASSNLTFTITDWWPYAKLAAGVPSPVWNSGTGALL